MESKKDFTNKLIEFAQKHPLITSIANSSDKNDKASYYFLITPPYDYDLVNEIKKFNLDLINECYKCNLFHYPNSVNIYEFSFIGEVFWDSRHNV